MYSTLSGHENYNFLYKYFIRSLLAINTELIVEAQYVKRIYFLDPLIYARCVTYLCGPNIVPVITCEVSMQPGRKADYVCIFLDFAIVDTIISHSMNLKTMNIYHKYVREASYRIFYVRWSSYRYVMLIWCVKGYGVLSSVLLFISFACLWHVILISYCIIIIIASTRKRWL